MTYFYYRPFLSCKHFTQHTFDLIADARLPMHATYHFSNLDKDMLPVTLAPARGSLQLVRLLT